MKLIEWIREDLSKPETRQLIYRLFVLVFAVIATAMGIEASVLKDWVGVAHSLVTLAGSAGFLMASRNTNN